MFDNGAYGSWFIVKTLKSPALQELAADFPGTLHLLLSEALYGAERYVKDFMGNSEGGLLSP